MVCGFVNSVDTFILFVGDDLFVWWWFCLLLLASSLIVCLVIGYLLFGNLFVCFVVCFVRLDNGLARVGWLLMIFGLYVWVWVVYVWCLELCGWLICLFIIVFWLWFVYWLYTASLLSERCWMVVVSFWWFGWIQGCVLVVLFFHLLCVCLCGCLDVGV